MEYHVSVLGPHQFWQLVTDPCEHESQPEHCLLPQAHLVFQDSVLMAQKVWQVSSMVSLLWGVSMVIVFCAGSALTPRRRKSMVTG